MDDERCETCRFWKKPTADDDPVGLCLRFPPVINQLAVKFSFEERKLSSKIKDQLLHAQFAGWDSESWSNPATCEEDWCGEYQRRPLPVVAGEG